MLRSLYRNKGFNMPAHENASGRQLWTLVPFGWSQLVNAALLRSQNSFFFFFFFSESSLHIMWPKHWSSSISPSNEYSGLISFRTDWFDLPAIQEMLKSLLQHHVLKLFLQCSAFFIVQLSHLYMTTGTKKHCFD